MSRVAERGYVHPELLAETDWLAERLNSSSVRIVDARSPAEYFQGHIPNAVSVPGMTLRGEHQPLELPPPDEFARLAGSIGVGEGTTVAVYDSTGPPAGRVWWAFTYFGHPDVRLLDGGLTKWLQEGRPVTREIPAPPSAPFTPRLVEGVYCGLDYAKSCVGKAGTILWDVRSVGEHTGAEPRDNPPNRAGRLPGAVHLEWSEMVDPKDRTLKPAAEMRRLLASRGITPEKEVVTY